MTTTHNHHLVPPHVTTTTITITDIFLFRKALLVYSTVVDIF
jgi:hypothetical protein